MDNRRTHLKSAMPAFPPPQNRALALRKQAAKQPGAMTSKELRATLRDYYAYHDPFKTDADIQQIVDWAKKRGIKQLNERLRAKYGEDLQTKEEEYRMRSRVLSKLITPGIVEAFQQDDYEEDDEDAFSSVSNNHDKAPVRNRTSSVVQDNSMKKRVEAEINNIEKSHTPSEIRANLIKFYRVVAPQRLETGGQEPAFLEEILTWTFRFGLPALANNLRVKYLGWEDEEQDDEQDDAEYIEGLQGFDAQREEPRPYQAMPEIQQPMEEQPVYQNKAFSKQEEAVIASKIKAFYDVYNPSRVAEGVEDLVAYVNKKGVDALNKKLRARYNDDLTSFEATDLKVQKDFKLGLFERLFNFYSRHDPTKVGGGLGRIISWTERNGYDALNKQLRDTYGADLESPVE